MEEDQNMRTTTSTASLGSFDKRDYGIPEIEQLRVKPDRTS